jgi:hypothetical protein
LKAKLSDWIEAFLTALEEERYQNDLAQRRRPELGRLYSANAGLFAIARITEVQRLLAGVTGAEERRARSLLEFLARSRAICTAAESLDQRLGWEIFGWVPVGESRIPHRQIPAALGLAGDPDRRRAIEEAHLQTLGEYRHLAEDFVSRHREGIAELGYGSHIDGLQVLGNIDLEATVREGERFLAETREVYLELLHWHLPRVAGVEPERATAADGRRLEAATDFDAALTGGQRNRAILETVAATGLDPTAEGRIVIEWEAYLAAAAGGVCRASAVPDRVRLAVSTRSGRPAVASFLQAYGVALHHAYTSPALPLEHRRLGDESVPLGTGFLFASLLRNPSFLARLYDLPRARIGEYLRLESLCTLLAARRDVARLQFEIGYYAEGADSLTYAELLTEATGLRHDPRSAVWEIDVELGTARRIRGLRLGTLYAATLRNRFDEDWFRNPRAGAYLWDLFSNGRRYSAAEVAVQLGGSGAGANPLLAELTALA